MSNPKEIFANEMAIRSLGAMAYTVMTGCERYGMCHGCDEDCPVLQDGKCELYPSVEEFLKEEAEVQNGKG